MNSDTLSKLAIPPEKKRAARRGPRVLLIAIVLFFAVGVAVWWATRQTASPKPTPAAVRAIESAPANEEERDVVLTVSGYVIPRERIEISPRFQGTVAWIGVKKGDVVRKGDVLVKLEEEEYRLRVEEAEARAARAEAELEFARAQLRRAEQLRSGDASSEEELDAARRASRLAEAELRSARASLELARLYLSWCTIRAPIDGVILEKLVSPNELVTPVNFGGSRGPSTAFLAMADLNDLQVEIDLNEVDTPKVYLNQRCRISPEAYPEKVYDGFVAEIAPEANRSKGTLQIKVQIQNPDRFLTPELSAKVEFLR
ncbi:MAG: efflux RND transporter periplasmic adaptor subunit [Kiritimatiellae bacterium]|nr:efflux RND transporter periplasmic adaptor subunit [Kiritimatiellia bacterium]MDW8458192.1 efflux RND transporter periplasmic adaptor subunit [Verrucomicrobiota bacterium]